jgi:hypothetical protein
MVVLPMYAPYIQPILALSEAAWSVLVDGTIESVGRQKTGLSERWRFAR